MVCGVGDSRFRAAGKAYESLRGLNFQAGLVDSLYMFRIRSEAATKVVFSTNFLCIFVLYGGTESTAALQKKGLA